MSKTTNSVSQAKTEGGKIKGSINAISQNVKGGAENAAAGAVPAAPAAAGSLPIKSAAPTPEVKGNNDIPAADGKGETNPKAGVVVGGGQNSDLQQKGGQPKQTKLWTTKRYKKEYEKSVREFKKTRKRFMSYLKRKIL
jgi:hypothetical protein